MVQRKQGQTGFVFEKQGQINKLEKIGSNWYIGLEMGSNKQLPLFVFID